MQLSWNNIPYNIQRNHSRNILDQQQEIMIYPNYDRTLVSYLVGGRFSTREAIKQYISHLETIL